MTPAARIAELFDTHDTPVVTFSGGLDSLALLALARVEAARRGRVLELATVDDELLSTGLLRSLETTAALDGVHLTRLVAPITYLTAVAGRITAWRTWDRRRRFGRPLPAGAITNEVLQVPDHHLVTREDVLAAAVRARIWPGSVVLLRGQRQQESIVRHLRLPPSSRLSTPRRVRHRVTTAAPIAELSRGEVLALVRRAGLQIPVDYAARIALGLRPRTGVCFDVADPAWRRYDPAHVARVLRAYPAWAAGFRYGAALGRPPARYRASLAGVGEAIDDADLPPALQAHLHRRLAAVRTHARTRPAGFPPAYVYQELLTRDVGAILPLLGHDDDAPRLWIVTRECQARARQTERRENSRRIIPTLKGRAP